MIDDDNCMILPLTIINLCNKIDEGTLERQKDGSWLITRGEFQGTVVYESKDMAPRETRQ